MDRELFGEFCEILPPEIVEKIEEHLDAAYRKGALRRVVFELKSRSTSCTGRVGRGVGASAAGT
ncbi:hypothetical protein BNJ_00219 [Kaumoebavirus]|uniref:hypothetical protein n=1 Tax=Kaumoebavirus TaxID=1859492 RepID=UPI0009C397A0|nr:hypothetical protein BNJ_00219 [Kaumoebavirus]ARA72048.1 hypothetical protein BNJ_00219 [Kaumoebavirus]